MDRAEAIEIIKRVDICANAAETARDMAIAALREQAVQPSKEGDSEREQSKWISVKERLPGDERSVLAYYGFGHNGTPDSDMMFTGVLSYFCFDPEPHWQHAGHGLAVTHWMPLPEPPKGGADHD